MKVITAIGNEIINNRLREIYNYEVIGKDIQYEDGILEIMEEVENIDLIILSNNLPNEYDFKILINKILKLKENVEIIAFLKEKNQDIENFLNSKNIYKIYYLDNIEIFFENIKKNNKLSVENFRNEIIGKIEDNKFKGLNIRETNDEKIENNITHNKLNRAKIIGISGVYGSGKSITSVILSKVISNNDKKVLIVDTNLNFSNLNIIFGIINDSNIKGNIVKIEENLDLLDNFYEINLHNIEELKKLYDFIIIDISSNLNEDYLEKTLNILDEMIVLVEPNISEINKSNIYINKIINITETSKQKIKIVFNKVNKNKISKSVLKEIFNEYEIIGEIYYSEKYNIIINRNIKNVLPIKEYEKIYEKFK